MDDVILGGSTARELAHRIAQGLSVERLTPALERFPDGELHVQLEADVRGRGVLVVQSLAAPCGEALLELLLMLDACRHAGAGPIRCVVPYLGYVRQDRRRSPGEALGGKVLAKSLDAAGPSEVMVVDLHTPAAEGWFNSALTHLSAVPLLVGAVRNWLPPDAVVVSPDLGAAKRAETFSEATGRPYAIIRKVRHSATEVVVRDVLGDVRGRPALIVDDMISTGGTILAAARALRDAGVERIGVAVTHGLLVGPALESLELAQIERLWMTDSIPHHGPMPFPTEVVPLTPLLVSALRAPRGR